MAYHMFILISGLDSSLHSVNNQKIRFALLSPQTCLYLVYPMNSVLREFLLVSIATEGIFLHIMVVVGGWTLGLGGQVKW